MCKKCFAEYGNGVPVWAPKEIKYHVNSILGEKPNQTKSRSEFCALGKQSMNYGNYIKNGFA